MHMCTTLQHSMQLIAGGSTHTYRQLSQTHSSFAVQPPSASTAVATCRLAERMSFKRGRCCSQAVSATVSPRLTEPSSLSRRSACRSCRSM